MSPNIIFTDLAIPHDFDIIQFLVDGETLYISIYIVPSQLKMEKYLNLEENVPLLISINNNTTKSHKCARFDDKSIDITVLQMTNSRATGDLFDS